MQRQDLNPGSLALGPALLMTLSPQSEERVRRGAPIMRYSPGERGLFRVQSPGFRWVSVSGRHPREAVGVRGPNNPLIPVP